MELFSVYRKYSSWIDFLTYFSIFTSIIRATLWEIIQDQRAAKLLIAGGGIFFSLSLLLWTESHQYDLQDLGLFAFIPFLIFIGIKALRFIRRIV